MARAKASAGERLLGWRRAAGLTQAAAGQRVGVSQPVWHEWERGTRRPGRERAAAIEALTAGLISAADWLGAA